MERNDPGPCRPSCSPPREGFASSEDRAAFLSAHLPLFEGFPLALLLTDPEDGRTVFANREALSLLAAAPEDLLDRVFPHGWKPLATLDGTPLVPEKAIPRDFREGTTGPLSFTLPSRKGETLALSLRSAPLRNQEGAVLCGMILLINVTPRWRYEQALRESERRHREVSTLLRSLCDNVPDLLWAKDLQKRFLFVNRAQAKMLLNAKDTEEPLGKTDLHFALRERAAHPEDPGWHTFGEICRDSDTLTLEAMAPSRFDEWGNVKGEFLYLDVHKAPFFDDQGNLLGTVGCGRDVTRERHMEEALAESEKRLKLALEGGEILAWDWDIPTGRVHLTPHPFGTDLPENPEGYPLEQLVGMVHPDDLPGLEETYQNLFQKKDLSRIDQVYRCALGEDRWVWSRGFVSQRDEEGKPLRVTGVAQDVTDRMKIRQRQERSEARYRTLFEGALDAFLVVDEKTDQIREANREAERLLGYPERGLVGTPLRLLPTATGPEGPLALRDLLPLKGNASPRELFVLNRQNRPIPVQTTGKRIALPDGEEALLVILRDLTPILRLRGDLLQSQKMQALGTLAEGMGHELNNLLAPLQGYAEMGASGHQDPAFCFSRILEGTKRARNLVRKLLLTSRPSREDHPRLDWRRFLEDHVSFLQDGLPPEVRVEILLGKEPFPLAADPAHLRQILLHLWSNALWATGTQGTIRIRLERVEVDPTLAALHPGLGLGPHGVLSVEDEGCGMSEEVRSRAFEPFFSTREAGQGTGLGLSVVHGLAIHYRGTVEVLSRPGAGTRVRLLLPLVSADIPPEGGDAP